MKDPDRPRLAVLAGPEASLSPADVASSADGFADFIFVLDSRDRSTETENLRMVAEALAPTIAADFTDLRACAAALRDRGTTAVITFTDCLCMLTAQLNAEIKGTSASLPQWGRKDIQRQTLRAAGLSRVQSA